MGNIENILLSFLTWILISIAHVLPEYILWTKAIATTLAIIISILTIYQFFKDKNA